jgi:integrase
MRYLDTYLVDKNVSEKNLTPNIVDHWIAECFSNLNSNTINGYIADYIQFAKHLNTLGIDAYLPVSPGSRQSYVPYIFSKEEINVIFDTADNIKSVVNPDGELWFPMLIRLLYGCGLRLAEALSLTFSDIDLDDGVLFIKNAKGSKDRYVPMDDSLAEILERYCITILSRDQERKLLFQNSTGNRIANNVALHWFRRVLSDAEIELLPTLSDTRVRTRNICLNCFRHTFAVTSLYIQLGENADNYRITPLLSTYLGHKNLAGTQKYLHMTSEISEDIHAGTSSYSKGLFPEVPR